jgi:hypothetical protein
MGGEIGERVRGHRRRFEGVEQAEGIELTHRVWQQVDADPEGLHLLNGFVHDDVTAVFVKAERGDESANATSDDVDGRCGQVVSGHSWLAVLGSVVESGDAGGARAGDAHIDTGSMKVGPGTELGAQGIDRVGRVMGGGTTQ